MPRITVLHENEAWLAPLRAALDALELPHDEWRLDAGVVPFDRVPEPGVYYSRMSASAHSRGHHDAPALARAALAWLEAHERRVINGSRALALELSKLAQHAALTRAGLRTPRTAAAAGRDRVIEAARAFGPGPWILKPNCGGKGLGVQLFRELDALAAWLDGPGSNEAASADGLWLIQDYIRPPEPFITRCEFVGGRFLYAVRVDTSEGFELCPADVCAIGDAACPVGESPSAPAKFVIQENFDDPVNEEYGKLLADNGVEIAGIELIRDAEGRIFTYDINTNTNYNPQAEAAARGGAGLAQSGAQTVARFLGEELDEVKAAGAGSRAAE